MSRSPSPQLCQEWLEAVLLPDEDDPETSCLKELAEYKGISEEEARKRCLQAKTNQLEEWEQQDRETADDLVDFYDGCEPYIYKLLWWHALKDGDTPAWNARLLDLAEEHGAESYLDFGGGIGTNGILLRRAGLDVTVADISTVLLTFARWRFERRELEGTFVDLKEQDLPADAYDMITAMDVLEHVADPLATIEDLTRCLRPGGLLIFNVIASKPDPEQPYHLLRSKYPIRSRMRGFGYRKLEGFQKYLVYQKVNRSILGNRLVRSWDILKWRTYYLLQGKWPSAQAGLQAQ